MISEIPRKSLPAIARAFPLLFKVFKPKQRLKEDDEYQTKLQLAQTILTELVEFGFKIELV